MAACRTCQTELPEGARFCPACGTSVDAPPTEGVERKVVTVLFADLGGSTAFTEARDPEDVRAVIQPYFARVRAELERYGGTFEKFIGDAVMALFGAPVSHEDDPDRAVRAALAIRDAIAESGALDPELGLHVRVAVHTGEAVIALGARVAEGEGMAAGDVVNTAFRMQEAAPPNGVVVGEQTYRATRTGFEYGEERLIAAKGKAEPVRVWEALRAKAPLRPAYIGPGLAPLVGRREELNLLIDTLTRVRREGSVQLLTLTGVPGIGKSRLVWELLTALEREPALVTWRRGRCLPYGEGVSFWALGEMVKAEAGILESDEAEQAREKVARCVRAVVPDGDASWIEAHLRPLAGVGLEPVPHRESRDEAFAAWRRFLEALAERGLLVLVFEDLHWADDGLLDFVDHLANWSQGVPLLLVGTARPELLERRPDWGGGKRNAATIALSPLSDDETDRLVDFLLRRARLPEAVRAGLRARAEGNPLYAEEYARMLGDRGLLAGDGAGADALPLPESVQGIIASRLDALPSDQKNLLHDAAVVGRGFWVGALERMADESTDALEPLLHVLELKDFVRRQRDSAVAGEPQYTFLHALVRDVSYAQIPRAQRARKHCLAAEWIESLARPEDHAEMLAHHYLAALEFTRAAGQDTSSFAERAAGALRHAGDRAFALNAFENAAGFYEGAVALVSDEDPERPGLLFRLGQSRFHASAAGEPELAAARDALVAAGDKARAAEAEVLLVTLAWRRGDHETSEAHKEQALELVDGLPPSPSKAAVLADVSRFLWLTNEPEEAIRVGQDVLRMAEALGLDEIRSRALDVIGGARVATGDVRGIEDREQSVELARRLNSPTLPRATNNIATTLTVLGELDRSFARYAEARAAAERFGDAALIRWLRLGELLEAFWTGAWDDAVACADAFIAECDTSPHYLEPCFRIFRGRVRLARGDGSAARADAEHGLELARRAEDAQMLYPSLAYAGRAAAETGATGDAGRFADELLGLATQRTFLAGEWLVDIAETLFALARGPEFGELAARLTPKTPWLEASAAYCAGDALAAADGYARIGSRPDEAVARVRAASALAERGNPAQADAQLERALEFYRSVGAAAYLRQAEPLLTGSA